MPDLLSNMKILTYLLTFYLKAETNAFYLAVYLANYLTWIIHSDILWHIITFILTLFYPTFYLAFYRIFYVTYILTFYVTFYLAFWDFYPAFHLTYCLALCSRPWGPLSNLRIIQMEMVYGAFTTSQSDIDCRSSCRQSLQAFAHSDVECEPGCRSRVQGLFRTFQRTTVRPVVVSQAHQWDSRNQDVSAAAIWDFLQRVVMKLAKYELNGAVLPIPSGKLTVRYGKSSL